MAMTEAEKKRAQRAKRKADGLKRYEFWLRPSEWPVIKRCLEQLRNRRK